MEQQVAGLPQTDLEGQVRGDHNGVQPRSSTVLEWSETPDARLDTLLTVPGDDIDLVGSRLAAFHGSARLPDAPLTDAGPVAAGHQPTQGVGLSGMTGLRGGDEGASGSAPVAEVASGTHAPPAGMRVSVATAAVSGAASGSSLSMQPGVATDAAGPAQPPTDTQPTDPDPVTPDPVEPDPVDPDPVDPDPANPDPVDPDPVDPDPVDPDPDPDPVTPDPVDPDPSQPVAEIPDLPNMPAPHLPGALPDMPALPQLDVAPVTATPSPPDRPDPIPAVQTPPDAPDTTLADAAALPDAPVTEVAPPVPQIADLPAAPGALADLTLPDLPDAGRITAATGDVALPGALPPPALIALPDAPVLAELRPVLQVSGGTIGYSSTGQTIAPPAETEAWSLLNPFAIEAAAVMPELVNGAVRINALALHNDHPVSVTFIGEGAGLRNSLGYYRIGDDGEISDVRIIWANASGAPEAQVLAAWQAAGATPDQLAAMAADYGRVNTGGTLIAGQTTVALDNLQAGDRFGFFLVANGDRDPALHEAMANADATFRFVDRAGNTARITPGMTRAPQLEYSYTDADGVLHEGRPSLSIFHTAAAGDTARLNTSGQQQVISGIIPDDAAGFWGAGPGDLLIGFEDVPRGRSDNDFNDLVFRLNVGDAVIQRLETVSSTPTVTISDPDGGALTGASVDLIGAHGLTLAFDGYAGPAGQIFLGDVPVDYRVEPSGNDLRLVLTSDRPVPAALLSQLLSSLSLTADGGGPIPAGDHIMRFQVTSTDGPSDIVETGIRVVHGVSGAITPIASTVVPAGPSNEAIAAANAAAEAAHVTEIARITALNAAISAAHADLATAIDAATETRADLLDARDQLGSAADHARDAITAMDHARSHAAEAGSDYAEAHQAATQAHDALATAVADQRAAAADLSRSQQTLDASTAALRDAHTGLSALRDDAVAARDAASQALHDYADAHDAAAVTADALDAAHAALQSAGAKAETAYATAAATEATLVRAIATAQATADAVAAQADHLSVAHSALRDALSTAETARLALAESAGALEDAQAAAARAHAACAADSGNETLARHYAEALSLHDATAARHEALDDDYRHALEDLAARFADHAAAVGDLSLARSQHSDALDALHTAQDQDASADAALARAVQVQSAAQDGFDRAADAHRPYQDAVDAAADQLRDAAGRAAAAIGQYDAARADYADRLAALADTRALRDAAAERLAAETSTAEDTRAGFQTAADALSLAEGRLTAAREALDAAGTAADAAMQDYAEARAAADAAAQLHDAAIDAVDDARLALDALSTPAGADDAYAAIAFDLGDQAGVNHFFTFDGQEGLAGMQDESVDLHVFAAMETMSGDTDWNAYDGLA